MLILKIVISIYINFFRFGDVYKGKYRGGQVAIKQMKSTDTIMQIDDFLRELELMV